MNQLDAVLAFALATTGAGAYLTQYEAMKPVAEEYNKAVEKRHQDHMDAFKRGFRKKHGNAH